MRAQAGDAAGEDQRGFARSVLGVHKRDRNGCVLEPMLGIAGKADECRAPLRDKLACGIAKRKHAAQKSMIAVSVSTASGVRWRAA